MDCRNALEILDCEGDGLTGPDEAAVQAAEAHLAECPRCLAIAENRRRLDREVGRVMRSVDVPRDAQERLLAKLIALETGAKPSSNGAISVVASPAADATADPVRPARRRMPGLVPLAACLSVAAIGFFSVIWLMTPRWTVAEVRQQLARIDFATLDTLPEFGGDSRASQLPPDLGSQKLDWSCHKIPKAWPDASRHQYAVYGFILPSRQRHAIRGLLAVIPVGQMRAPPVEQSLLSTQAGDYLSAQIGEAVTVAWTENNLVYVCVIEGGGESLSTLQQLLGPSAA